jgi:hypothetical protein
MVYRAYPVRIVSRLQFTSFETTIIGWDLCHEFLPVEF